MCRHPLSRPISKPLPDGPRKQELEPIPAQSLLRFPAMVAARDCGQQLVATLGRLTLPHTGAERPCIALGLLASWAGPRAGRDAMHSCVKPRAIGREQQRGAYCLNLGLFVTSC